MVAWTATARFELERWLLCSRRGSVIVEADPLRIEYRKLHYEWPRYLKRWPFWLCGGNWDTGGRPLEPFRERQVRELWEAGGDYRQTPTYRAMLEELQQHGAIRIPPLTSVEALERYFEVQYQLMTAIREYGYSGQAALGGKPSHEITVRIDREGRLVKCREGSHRLAMLRVLEVRRAPITVDLAHSDWARSAAACESGPIGRRLRRALERSYGPILAWPRTWPG